MASRGLLWVGTNVGIALTVPLPRLEGVPIISGRANISYHAHYGSVTFFLNVQHKVISAELPDIYGSGSNSGNNGSSDHNTGETDSMMIMEESEQDLQSEDADTESLSSFKPVAKPEPRTVKLRHRNSSPPLRARPRIRQFGQDHEPDTRRFSKTLPRGFSLANSEAANNEFIDVYGLYGDLWNVKDYSYVDGGARQPGNRDSICSSNLGTNEEARKSDPEISTIQHRVTTLDRRMRMKSSRPRSLDMSSTWSMESRGSSSGGHTTTSSSEAGSARPSPCVSRNASFQSNHSSIMMPTTHTNCDSTNAPTSQPTPPLPKPPSKSELPKLDLPKTVTTIMGGRGYINWRRATVEKQRTSALAQINNSDAFLVIWEMKT